MARVQKIVLWMLLLGGLAGLTYYFLSNPERRRVERQANLLYVASPPGAHLADAIGTSPNFFTINFGDCGQLTVSAAARDIGPLAFYPRKGPVGRFASFEQFLQLNGGMFASDEKCREVTVVYMAKFPVRAQVRLLVNEHGRIRAAMDPLAID